MYHKNYCFNGSILKTFPVNISNVAINNNDLLFIYLFIFTISAYKIYCMWLILLEKADFRTRIKK